jgi:uncharacterized RDD family membrane protein YckC
MVAAAPPRVSVSYAGIATRGIALAVDAAVANAIVLLIAALVALIGSLVGDLRPEWLVALLTAVGWISLLVGYFTLFWSTTGQTPGMRLMRLRVVTADGARVHFLRALIRVVFLGLCIVPLGAGFLPVLFDERRRGCHDLVARTVVIYVPVEAP